MLGSSGGGMPGSSSEGGSSAHGDGGGGGTETVGTTSIMSGGIGNSDEKGGHAGGDYFEGDRSTGGNRWPRQETIALLKIRSDMDAVFRDSSLKGPLWDEISRKMAELGYHRSAKKCKEKFENVYKYHKRTKDGRVGKSEGKTYRFFDQLEAFDQHHSSSSPHPPPLPPSTPRAEPAVQAAVPVTMVIPAGTNPPTGVVTVTSSPHQYHVNLSPMSQPPQQQQQQPYQHHFTTMHHASAVEMENGSSPSATPSSSSSTSSDEELIGRRKRKRKWKGFFEKMMNEVINKQEELQKRFLEVVEKREHDRLVREETWKAQEMDRLNQKHEILIRERSMVAAKDAALIEILKKISDQHNIDLPLSVQTEIQTQIQPVVTASTATVTQSPPQPQGAQVHVHENIVSFAPVVPIQAPPQTQPVVVPIQTPPQPQPRVTQVHVHENIGSVTPSVAIQAPPQPQPQLPTQTPPHLVQQPALVVAKTISTSKSKGGDNELQPSSSRWPKAEIDALINLRSKLDQKYQEGGPKGPLWEEISSSMKHLGYNRNAKRCKEKWENINKYYKKVKESNKKRPEDSKTCPYFDQLDALYREKTTTKMDINTTITPNIPTYNNNPSTNTNAPIFKLMKPENPIMARPEQQWPPGQDHAMEDAGSDNDSEDEGDDDDDEEGSGGYEIVANTSNNNGANSMSTATSTNNKATQV
ncbi:trihelix transcription factor GT-2-like [Silene latifolia]|uniref:trihelix transcription factor GT-2-like n=1 Tax=Silene latifolia TaxID=37657 RepID=UPI003D786A75